MIFPKITIVTAINSISGPIDVCLDGLFSMGNSMPNLNLTFVNYSGKENLSKEIKESIISKGINKIFDEVYIHTEECKNLENALIKGIEISREYEKSESELVMTLYPGIETDSSTLFCMLKKMQSTNASCVSAVYFRDDNYSPVITKGKKSYSSIQQILLETEFTIDDVDMGCALWNMKDFAEFRNRKIIIDKSLLLTHYDAESGKKVGILDEDQVKNYRSLGLPSYLFPASRWTISANKKPKGKNLVESKGQKNNISITAAMSKLTKINELANECIEGMLNEDLTHKNLKEYIDSNLWKLFENPTDETEEQEKRVIQKKLLKYLMLTL